MSLTFPSHSLSVSAFSLLSLVSLLPPTFFAQAHHSSWNPRWHSFRFFSFVLLSFSLRERFLRILRSGLLVPWCRFSRLMDGFIPSISRFRLNFLSGILRLHCLLSQRVTALMVSDFGFQMTYGISTTDDPGTYIQMDSIMVAQYAQLFNFTGNLLANKFWWNVTTAPLDAGSYLLTSSASFFACSDGSENGTLSPSLFQS